MTSAELELIASKKEQKNPPRAGGRLLAYDQAKGFLIVLVVLGHLLAPQQLPPGQQWYLALFNAIYLFHMPAFFFVGGILSYGSIVRAHEAGIWRFIVARANRLMVPFLVVGLLIGTAKMIVATRFAGVAVRGFAQDSWRDMVVDLFWHTSNSAAGLIWYLVVYFMSLCLIIPFCRSKWGIVVAIAFGLLMYLTGLPEYAYLNKLAAHFVFFALGLAAQRWGMQKLSERFLLPVGAMLLVLLYPALNSAGHESGMYMLIFGTLMPPLLVAVFSARRFAGLDFLGRNSMAVYLFHMGVIFAFSVAGGKIFGVGSLPWFTFMLLFTLPMAVIVPILLRRAIAQIAPPVGRYLA